VAGGQGQPASAGRAFRLTKRPAPRASRKCRSCVVPEGRKYPAVARRACFVAPRHAGGVSPIRPRGFSRRVALCAASGLNGQEGADPSDGVRLPTRSKPSKGVALVGMWTSSELSSGSDGELHGNPANPRSGTGMQQARNPRRGVNRRSGEIPQGRNENRGWHNNHGPNPSPREIEGLGGVDARGHIGGGAPDNPKGGRGSSWQQEILGQVFGASKVRKVWDGLSSRSTRREALCLGPCSRHR
jgi:hypothetical protein